MKWESGRQDATSSLKKLKIWSRWNTDCYLLKLDKASIIGNHLDPVEGKRHYRLNITLSGLWFLTINGYAKFQKFGNFHFFRPDIEEHSATFMTPSLILTFGIAL